MTGQGKKSVDYLLAESFKELVSKHPIEKITIKEITDKAGVIRPTFYNHFQDKYELLEWIIKTELITPMTPLLHKGMINQALLFFFSNIECDNEFYKKASRLEGQNSFGSIMENCIKETLTDVLNMNHPRKEPVKWLTSEVAAAYYAQSMCAMVIRWIQTGMKATPQEMVDIYNFVESRSFDEVYKIFRNP